MKKIKSHFWLDFLLFLLIFAVICAVFAVFSIKSGQKTPQNPLPEEQKEILGTVILDAGHGGEDGGAVSASGIYEKDLNLAVCEKLKANLENAGYEVIMTRTEDVLLYDKNSNFQGHKKVQDITARENIGNAHPDALFISIHMNSFPQKQYCGLQVWYSPNNPISETLAENIQSAVKEELQPNNNRRIKVANSQIRLLYQLQSPAVLVECGFLSNEEEAKKLSEEDYQAQLASIICNAVQKMQKD